jgi:hypothetical protein
MDDTGVGAVSSIIEKNSLYANQCVVNNVVIVQARSILHQSLATTLLGTPASTGALIHSLMVMCWRCCNDWHKAKHQACMGVRGNRGGGWDDGSGSGNLCETLGGLVVRVRSSRRLVVPRPRISAGTPRLSHSELHPEPRVSTSLPSNELL